MHGLGVFMPNTHECFHVCHRERHTDSRWTFQIPCIPSVISQASVSLPPQNLLNLQRQLDKKPSPALPIIVWGKSQIEVRSGAATVCLSTNMWHQAVAWMIVKHTHLPTVWLASCFIRLNCFFMFVPFCVPCSSEKVSGTSERKWSDPKVALRRSHCGRRGSLTHYTSLLHPVVQKKRSRIKQSPPTSPRRASRCPSRQVLNFQ